MKNLLILVCLWGSSLTPRVALGQVSVIPMREQAAHKILIQKMMASGWIKSSSELPPGKFRETSYMFETSDEKIWANVDAFSGDVYMRNENVSKEILLSEYERMASAKFDTRKLSGFFDSYARKVHSQSSQLNTISIQPYSGEGQRYDEKPGIDNGISWIKAGNTAMIHATQVTSGVTQINNIWLYLDRETMAVLSLRTAERSHALSAPRITLEQVRQLAEYQASGGATRFQTPLSYEMNEAQKDYLIKSVPHWEKPTPYVEEDEWFLPRKIWRLPFEFGTVYVDADTGHFIGRVPRLPNLDNLAPVEADKIYKQLFELPEKRIIPKPSFYIDPTATEYISPKVIFNSTPTWTLHFPPQVMESSCVMAADYFPSFLITTQRTGNQITLQGQLPDKGKKATLTLGETSALVDEKPVTLSAPPQEIDGRLYLPFELLTLCNGVLTRFDKTKNTLWVDTRFLRRPDPLETAKAPATQTPEKPAPKAPARPMPVRGR